MPHGLADWLFYTDHSQGHVGILSVLKGGHYTCHVGSELMFNGRAHSMVQLFHNLTWFETLADFFSFAQVHCGAACVRK